MDISVVISTFNRSKNLDKCIEHLDKQEDVDDLEWEVVIVDNNSNDDTAQVVRQLEQRYGINIVYVFERNQGLSNARNSGIHASGSDYVAFIDDDILVAPLWLRSIYDAFVDAGCDAVGGRILVDSPLPIPKWIQPDMYGFLGQRDFGDKAFVMDGVTQFPFGGNMAIKRTMIEKIGGFNTSMGRKGEGKKRQELFKGEETDYFRRVREADGIMFYSPGGTVRHKILPHQLKKKFFRTIHYNAGYQKAYLETKRYKNTLLGIPLFIFRQLASATGKYIWQLLTMGTNHAFRQQMNVGYMFGMLAGYYNRARKMNA